MNNVTILVTGGMHIWNMQKKICYNEQKHHKHQQQNQIAHNSLAHRY